MKLLPVLVALSLLVGCSSKGREVVILSTTKNEIGSHDAANKSVSPPSHELDLQVVFGERDMIFVSWSDRLRLSGKPQEERWLKFLNEVRGELLSRFGVTLDADVESVDFSKALKASLEGEGFMQHSVDDNTRAVSKRDEVAKPLTLFKRQVWAHRSTLFSR